MAIGSDNQCRIIIIITYVYFGVSVVWMDIDFPRYWFSKSSSVQKIAFVGISKKILNLRRV